MATEGEVSPGAPRKGRGDIAASQHEADEVKELKQDH